jgi:hypothetical protein
MMIKLIVMTILIWILVLFSSLYLSSNIVKSVIIKKETLLKNDIIILWTVYILSIVIYLVIAFYSIAKLTSSINKVPINNIIDILLPFSSKSKKIVAIISVISVLFILPLNILFPPQLSSVILEEDNENYYHKMSLISFFKSISLSIFVIWIFIVYFVFTHADKSSNKN